MKIRFSDNKEVFRQHTEGIPFLSFCMLDELGVPNLYSTRFLSWDEAEARGREGLRTALMAWDDISEAGPVITEVRDRLARQIGSSIEHECITDQKHTNHVHVAKEEDLGVVWPRQSPLHRQYVDGVVTDIPDALLTAFGGDCPPVYLADPVRGAVGLVHAGWKGTLGRIPAVGIAQMTVHFGCDPSDMYAAIGPGVCRDCYEMGDEVYEAFAEQWSPEDAERIFGRYPARRKNVTGNVTGDDVTGDGPLSQNGSARDDRGWKYHLDLFEANRLTLIRAGIPADHIAVSNVCTMCNADTFYSYRAGRLENEQAAMIVNRFAGA